MTGCLPETYVSVSRAGDSLGPTDSVVSDIPVLGGLLQISPQIVGVSVSGFRRDRLIEAQREILRDVEMQFFYTRDLGVRTNMDTMQRMRTNAYSDEFTPSAESGGVQDEIQPPWCR